MPRLSAIVPATNRPPTLDACLAALARARPDEVIVVEEPAGSGPAAARNEGAARATGDVLVFVDADVLVHDDALDRIRAAMGARPELVGLLGSYDDRVVTRGLVAGFRNLLHHVVHQRSAGPAATFWAGLGAVRRDAFAAAGGFDAGRYPRPSIEDVELGGRLAALGPLELDPAVQGTHCKEWTLGSMVATDVLRRGIPWVELIVERGEVPSTLNLGARERMSVVAGVGAALGAIRGRPALAAAALGAQVALNRDLYGLLRRRLGTRGAVAGSGLHVVHHVCAAASVPAGVASGLRRRARARRR